MPRPLFLLPLLLALAACVEYEADPFTGRTLPRVTGHTTGVTNDWLYINLRTGKTYNAEAPCRDFAEGMQRDSAAIALDWDIAFCGHQLRTNSGTSGKGRGGAADLGYGGYNSWTSKSQVDNLDFEPDNDSTVMVTVSRNDWTKYLLANGLDFESNPWFDPNVGPRETLSSANPVLSEAIAFAAPPPSYTPSLHTYCVRAADGKRYFKFQVVSWYDPQVEIGGEGGRVCYYVDELN